MTDTDTNHATSTDEVPSAWHPTACILCECNCGIEIRLGADGRTFERTRGDKAHPASEGYTCEKALRLDYYQNGRGERLLSPLRRRADGTFEAIDWDTAIREVADRLAAVRDAHGGESIVYYGGGGQGNHLGGVYGSATLKALGVRFRANAISQEKTGEVLVMGKMFGTPLRGDFEHCEVAFFVGKNPWISHGIPHARTTLKAIAADPDRAMIVIDPRVTETAAMADFHLQVRSGRDAWLIAAMAAVLVDEGLVDRDWLDRHASGVEPVLAALEAVPITRYCEISGVDETLVRAATRRIASAASVAVFEDLGVQMNRHSTLVSYLEKLVSLLTGSLNPEGVERAGFGSGPDAGNRLFDAIVDRPSGVVFTDDAWEATWARIQTDDGLVHLDISELLDELVELRDATPPGDDPDWPLLLSAGERRSFTANTILRDPAWRKKDAGGSLRVSPADADRLGLVDGDTATLTRKRASVAVTVAVDDTVQSGHVSLPNGLGLDHVESGARHQTGVAPNELTASEDRDPWAGTPWHKTVPARLERASA
ncbi:MAG: hypothetical protein E6G06_14610 [Actinobacteria bacterium]|nr:MAG: hypothetical protein E6G06_14610 [Actinomycetota bacterium]